MSMNWTDELSQELNAIASNATFTICDNGETLKMDLSHVLEPVVFAKGFFAGLALPQSITVTVTLETPELYEQVLAAAKANGFTLQVTESPNHYLVIESEDTRPLPNLSEENLL